MKLRLLDFIVCPVCKTEDLKAKAFEENQGEITQGLLQCPKCSREYPVADGIPRLLPDYLIVKCMQRYHKDFLDRFGGQFRLDRGASSKADDRLAEKIVRTMQGYSYHNLELEDHDSQTPLCGKEYFYHFLPMLDDDYFKGKTGIDVGCGGGRHVFWATRLGAEMVGMDLSEAVQLAQKRNRDNTKAHFVQADIFNMPFREGAFDFAYSIGVLHHLPAPQKGFEAVKKLPRKGGDVFVWVYGLKGMRWSYRLSHISLLRPFVADLPIGIKVAASAVIAGFLQVFIWIPVSILSKLPNSRNLVERIPFSDGYSASFRAKMARVFDRIQPPVTYFLTKEQIQQWLCGLKNVGVLDTTGRGWAAQGGVC